jgi:hypothetical protein
LLPFAFLVADFAPQQPEFASPYTRIRWLKTAFRFSQLPLARFVLCNHAKYIAATSTGERGSFPRRKTNLGAATNFASNFRQLESQRFSSHKNWTALPLLME